MPSLPPNADGFPPNMPFHICSYGADLVEGSPGMVEWEQGESQKLAWTELFRPMVHGHPLTPFVRMAFVGDITSSLAAELGRGRTALLAAAQEQCTGPRDHLVTLDHCGVDELDAPALAHYRRPDLHRLEQHRAQQIDRQAGALKPRMTAK